MENGKTDTKIGFTDKDTFMKNVYNNMIFNGMPEDWYKDLL